MTRNFVKGQAGMLGLMMGLGATALAATPPDAGQTLRELQAPAAPATPRQPAPTLSAGPVETPEAGEGADIAIPVQKVTITGNTAISTEELLALVTDLPGRTATLDALQAAAQRITEHYRKAGFLLARAYLPAQEIREGQLTIAVVEGRVDAIAVDNRSRVKTPRVQAQLADHLPVGRPVRTDASNRALLLLQETPGIGAVQGGLRPGAKVGGTEVAIGLTPEPLVTGYIGADNFGNRFTGQGRLSGGLNFNSPMGYGDRLALQAVVSEDGGLGYGRLAWDAPLGHDGLRLGASLGSTRYELGGSFAALGAEGSAQTASLYGRYPFLLTPDSRASANLSFERRELHDEQASVGFDSRKSSDAAVLSLEGSFSDALLGSAASSGWRVAGTYGRLDLETASVALIDAATARTAGDYGKLALTLTREQRLAGPLTFYVSGNGQYAHKNLDSSEQFVLGGPSAIRAYPTGEGVGDQGWVATAELRWRVVNGVSLAGFYDAGGIETNRKPYVPIGNGRRLQGGGIAARAAWQGFALDASLAWRGDDVPSSDRDRHPRGWVTGSWSF
jgi:hemolysin activation/secretion protein